MRLTLNYCSIADVEPTDPKPSDSQKKNRKVYINCDEEDFFELLDSINPQTIIKYLDMRKVSHRDAIHVNVTNNKVVLAGNNLSAAQRGLYRMNKRNQKKLDRVLGMLKK